MITVGHLEVDLSEVRDLHIGAIGFESRSGYVLAEGIRSRRVVLFPYVNSANDAYARNLAAAVDMGAELRANSSVAIMSRELDLILGELQPHSRVSVDISSFDRRRLATLVLKLREHRIESVDFLYVPSRFSQPFENKSEVLEAGPVLPEFAGQLRRSSIPLTAVIGLGYEPERAAGVFELLEPNKTWAFLPDSNSPEYAAALVTANRLLLHNMAASDVLTYPVLQPLEIYIRLESFVRSLNASNRLVLVPMGPKVFALCCFLLALGDEPNRPAVWRVGDMAPSPMVDVHPLGSIVGLKVNFSDHEAPMSSS